MALPSFHASYLLVHLFAAGLTAALAVYLYTSTWEKPLGKVFTTLLVAFTVWTVFSMPRLFVTDETLYLGLTTVKYLGVATAPVWLFLLAIIYADGEELVTRRTAGALLVVPLATVAVVATTASHGLFYTGFETVTVAGTETLQTSRGPWFWGFAIYGWGLIAVGSMLLLYGAFRLPALYRTHALLVALGVAVPWAASLAYILEGWPHPAVDPTPVGFAAAGVLWVVGMYSSDLVDVSPVARSRVVAELDNPVFVFDTDDRLVDVNDAASLLLGDHEPFGTPAGEALPAGLRERFESGPHGRLHREGPVELTIGEVTRYFQSRVISLSGGRHGSVLVLYDVTDLEQQKAALEKQNDRLDEFAAVISHDLRNPLTVAKGRLQLLREAIDDPAAESDVEEVASALDRMEALTEDLLALAQQGKLVGEREAVELERAAHSAWSHVDTAGATLEVNGGLAVVDGDPSRVEELFENLFRNAIEHAGPSVTVRVGRLHGGFVVEDDGPGIPAADREEVFDHGYSTSEAGTGFGLSIVRTIVEAHGWEIRATEAVGGGARFEITTHPARAVSNAADAEAET